MTNQYSLIAGKLYSFGKLCCAVVLASAAIATKGAVVYENLTTPTGFYATGTYFGPYLEIADDVELDGTARIFQSLSIAYAAYGVEGLSPAAKMLVNLYAMDGAPTDPYPPDNDGSFGFPTPGTVLFSGEVCLDTDGPSFLATLTDNSGSIILPNHVAVGVSFVGIDFDTNDAGPLVFDPPTIGSSYPDFWIRGHNGDANSPWGLYVPYEEEGLNVNFAIQITAIPDGGAWMNMLALPALLGFQSFMKRRSIRKA